MNNISAPKKKAYIAVSLIFIGAADRNRTGDLRITKAHEINFYIIVFVVFIISHGL